MLDYEFYLEHVVFYIVRRFLMNMESKKKRWRVLTDIVSNYGYHGSLVCFARFSISLSRIVRTNLASFSIAYNNGLGSGLVQFKMSD